MATARPTRFARALQKGQHLEVVHPLPVALVGGELALVNVAVAVHIHAVALHPVVGEVACRERGRGVEARQPLPDAAIK